MSALNVPGGLIDPNTDQSVFTHTLTQLGLLYTLDAMATPTKPPQLKGQPGVGIVTLAGVPYYFDNNLRYLGCVVKGKWVAPFRPTGAPGTPGSAR